MRWPQDATNWPMSDHSRQVLCRPHRWHIQEDGAGDTTLLIHGAGAATQSFRHLFPILAQSRHVVAIDLPGQGFTQLGAQQRCGLDPMAEDMLRLIHHEGWHVRQVIGHSAGAAIALRLWELGLRPGQGIVGINAALGHFKGVAGWLFPILAKALAITPLSATFFAGTTTRRSVHSLIEGTGSTLNPAGLELYYRLAKDRGHVDATLSMMAQWSLDGLLQRMGGIEAPVHLITGANDLAVPPDTSADAAKVLPHARLTMLPNLGHLAHEEDADTVAGLILSP